MIPTRIALLVVLAGLALVSCGSFRTIIFFGDSITEEGDRPGGYVDLIRQELRASATSPVQVIGAGISGNKVPDLQARLQRDVLSRSPDLVVIFIGINDVWHERLGIGGTPRDRYDRGLRDLAAKIQAGGGRVLFCTPTVVGEKAPGENPLDAELDAYAAITRAVAASTGSGLCELRTAIQEKILSLNPSGAEQGVLTRDGVHLNAAGNRFLADRILACLASQGPRGGPH
jgi:lysophospholipase L1-like esterase